MNERISELAKSCMIEEYNQHGNLIEDGFDYGKFAELIVRECAKIVATNSLPDAYSEPCLALIAEEIKEHFGVEE